jgi:hypothetical protein
VDDVAKVYVKEDHNPVLSTYEKSTKKLRNELQKSLDAKTYAQQVKVGIAEAAPLHAGFAKEDL